MSTAFLWYKKAADAGFRDGILQLARLYETGQGTAKNWDEAARLYKLAEADGEPTAAEALQRIATDREAARLYKLAADQGDPAGQANLGFFYQNGLGGLPKDEREAARLYKLAADQGNAWAQNRLRSLAVIRRPTLGP